MNNHTERTGNKSRIRRRILLLLATVITALAVAVACVLSIDMSKTVSVDEPEYVDIRTSATTRTNVSGNYSGAGAITNGDVFNFTGVTTYTLTLPKGEYYFEAYGAQGGNGYGSTQGGYGGYSYGIINLPDASTTLYIVVGGVGTSNRTVTSSFGGGGYNGGGHVKGSNAAGGGGASDIRIGTNTLYYRVIVAGGGGGAGWSVTANNYTGRGGGTSGQATGSSGSWYSYAGGLGGTQTAGGSYSGSTYNYYGLPSAGSFGQGGQGVGYSGGGGGGGGGWYGGGGGEIRGGGGGSGFVLSTSITSSSAALPSAYFGNKTSNTAAYYKYRMTSANTTTSTRTGNGMVKITVRNVNQAPVSQSYNIPTVPVRGATSISVAASTLAKDNDYTNISGGNINNVYFTQGLSSNNDTSPTANTGLFLDAACTVNASKYMNYSWSGGNDTSRTTLTISNVFMLPRSGVDSQTANNKFTLYTKVRDAFGTNTTRGIGVAMFTMSVSDRGIAVNSARKSESVGYKLGTSTHYEAADRSLDYGFNNDYIYNPQGANIPTLFIPKSMSPTDTKGYTINASDIFNDADTAYDKVAFKRITVLGAYSAYNNYYNLTLNSNSSYATGLFPSFTLKPSGLRPTGAPFVVMQITAQTSETNSKAQIGSELSTLYLVFRISNTRPYLGSTEQLTNKKSEPIVTVAPGESKTINLKNYLTDIDDGNDLKATFAQGANDLKVPTNEYIQVDMSNTEVPLATNVNSNYAGKSAVNIDTSALSSVTGEGDNEHPTYFKKWSVAAQGSSAAASANLTYRYVDSQTIEFTGRTATQNQYRKDGLTDNSRLGHLYVLVRVVDASDVSDNGIWIPIALQVTSEAPTEPDTFANVTLGFTNFDAGSDGAGGADKKEPNKGEGDEAILTPIGYLDSEGNLRGVGSVSTDSDAVIPFAFDADAYLYSGNVLNDFVTIDESNGEDDIILDNDAEHTGTFFNVTLYTIHAARSYFAMIPDSELSNYGLTLDNNNTTVSFKGLKITALRSTNDEYFQFRVRVKDSHGQKGIISVCVKVDNRAVSKRFDPNSGLPNGSYKINALQDRAAGEKTPYGEYATNANLGSNKTVNYTIEVQDEVQITPYDFAFDFDSDPESFINRGDTLNSNPLDEGYGDVKAQITKKYSIAHTENPATSAADKEKSDVTVQPLSFVNPSSIESYGTQYSNYIDVEVNNLTENNIPTITVTGVSRTTSAIVQLHFTITDGTDNVDCMVTVTVLNSAPMLNPDLSSYYLLSADPSVTSGNAINTRMFYATEIAVDKDRDTPIFVAGKAKVVAKDGNNYVDTLYYDAADGKYYGTAGGDRTTVKLSDYINVTITKGTGGADALRVQGLSSTELIDKPIYIEFEMRDGYRAQEKTAKLHLPIGVINSDPTFVSDGLLLTNTKDGDKYTWLIGFELEAEKLQKRYIFNSKELYDSSRLIDNKHSAMSIKDDNKLYMFADSDTQQRVILNPVEYADRTDLVVKYDNKSSGEAFTSEMFAADAYKKAAVVYSAIYKEQATVNSYTEKAFINLKVRFFQKLVDENGVVTFQEYSDDADVRNCEYWAIEITDPYGTGTSSDMQIAISVKDSHHGKNLYTTPLKDETDTEANVSELKILNLYYNYRRPGILAMHTYYRTDPNVESRILVDNSNVDAGYLVDPNGVSSSDFADEETDLKTEYDKKETTYARKVQILNTVKFKDDFKYRYFEKNYVDGQNTYATFKHYPSGDNKFAYKPIAVQSTGSVIVPMSYIALPQGAKDTINGTHVTFANAGNTQTGINTILDANYISWKTEQIASNISISDGTNTYTIANNPYINVVYTASKNGQPIATTQSNFINKQRFNININDHNSNSPYEPQPSYREDYFGFTISKKDKGVRAPGLLTMTLALKTIDKESEGLVEMIDVEINLVNAKPYIQYHDGDPDRNQPISVSNDYVDLISSVMTIGNTSKSTISLLNGNEVTDAKDAASVGKIFYADGDSTDTMKFYIPSALGKLTRDEVKYVLQSGSKAQARNKYYNVTDSKDIDGAASDTTEESGGSENSEGDQSRAGKVNPYTYNPNPNYDKFFDISPAMGSSSSLQFIPKAKTIPVFRNNQDAQEYYDKYNLKVEDGKLNTGKVYYPFRILFYDDCNGSSFTEGHWFVAIIKVFIENDPISVDTSFVGKNTYTLSTTSTDSAIAAYKNKAIPMYKLLLSTSTEFYVDATSLFNDDDILLTDDGTFVTAEDQDWTDLITNHLEESYLKDYIVMPAAGDFVYLTGYEPGKTAQDKDSLPFEIRSRISDTSDPDYSKYGSLPRTTFVFKAKSAFRDPIRIGYKFRDSGSDANTYAYIVFSLEYNNEAPTPNRDTFGSASTIDISMKSRESFYLYASDYTKFGSDALGGFDSYAKVKTNIYDNPNYEQYNLPKVSAADLSGTFKYFTSRYDSEGYSGNSLILASDDAPTTLRIVKYSDNLPEGITITPELRVSRENSTSNGYLRLKVDATAVLSANVSVLLEDGSGKQVEVVLRVNVVSSAPTVKGENINTSSLKLDYKGNSTYELAMQYGQTKAISLRDIMSDIDTFDDYNFSVYKGMDGTQFSVTNPGSDAVISVVEGKNNSAVNHVIITATDFINMTGDRAYTEVRFRVQDAHGALSTPVIIKVTIAPANVTSVVSGNNAYTVELMSYAEYIDASGNAAEPQQITIVQNDGAKMFKDVDSAAPSAQYNVDIYVLLSQNAETGVMNRVQYNPNGNNTLLYSRAGSSETYNTRDAEAIYVSQYFTLSVSDDGESILFTPNAATITNNRITDIPLYVVVRKRYSDGTAMNGVGAQMGVKVKDSKLMATENTAYNVGYPTVGGSDDLRDSEFLEFTGSKGDSLTWNLYDNQDIHLGLFYDYDMLNLPDGGESIKYLDYSYTIPNEISTTSVPVLGISYNDNAKTVTITINRNIVTGQPTSAGFEDKPTAIEVSIFAVDAVNNIAGVTKNDKDKVSVTKIIVNVCNDEPEISQTGLVTRCPHCGKSESIKQESANRARCGSCNKTFKSLDPTQLGYTLANDPEKGYVMNITLENTKSCRVAIADIIDDADIDMDVYVPLNDGGENSLVDRSGTQATSVRAGEENAFAVSYVTGINDYNISTLTHIVFTCRSITRGAVAECTVKFRDSYIGAETSVLTIRLTVDNIAPTIKANAKTNLTVMGVGGEADEAQVGDAAKVYSILDFVDDVNGDNFDPTLQSNQNRRATYTCIDKIDLYMADDEVPNNRPKIYGPNMMTSQLNPETGEEEEVLSTTTACNVNWVEDDPTHQKFAIEPIKGIYGVQKVVLTVYDNGYVDGSTDGVEDGKALTLTLTITIANPLDDVDEVLEAKAMVYGVTRSVSAEDLLGEDNAQGYIIKDIVEIDTHYLTIIPPANAGVSTSADEINIDGWRIYASIENVSARVRVTFAAGDITRERILPITIVTNNKPQYKNGITEYRYTVSQLDDKEQRTIKIKPTDWFEDTDAEDVMTFISPVESSQSVKVEVVRAIAPSDEGGQPYLLLKFNRRGESVITVNLMDLSGRSYTYEIVVECTDAPELSWWENTVSLIEDNWMWFWIIVGGAVLFIILLIVIIVVVHKKRKMRREIEALLESETELEEEMLRLSSGAAYQSFGYLPPTQQGMVNPGMMLGGGAGAPQPNSLQLNAGTGPTVNNIPPTRQQVPPQQSAQQAPPSGDGFDPNDF